MKYTSFIRNLLLVFILTAATCLLIWLTGRYILTVNFYATGGQPVSEDPEQAAAVMTSIRQWVYLFSALYVLVKLLAITGLLSTALYLNNCRVAFGKVFTVVAASEYIFLVPAALKICLFRHVFPKGSLDDWHRFYVLSVLSLARNVPADWIYPLQALNVFEVMYWFILAFGLYKIAGMTYDRSLRLVVTAYVPALVIWIVAAVFSSLLLFPQTG